MARHTPDSFGDFDLFDLLMISDELEREDKQRAVARERIIQDKIEECLAHIRRGETDINVRRGDLTDREVQRILDEVARRVKSRNY